MRLAILLCAAALGVHAQSVEGKVINDATGQPISKATLLLRGANNSIFHTESDGKGQYAFAGLEPGKYTLTAERVGFVTAAYTGKKPQSPSKPLVFERAAKATAIDVRLVPAGAITGKVLFADGQPAIGASLTLLQANYVDGRRQLVPASLPQVQSRGLMSPVNDLGEFRIPSLEPGRYYLSVDANQLPGSSLDVHLLGNPRTPVRTYFRTATDPRNAQPIDVRSGVTTSDIAIVVVEMPTGTVRGRLDAPAATAAALKVVLAGPDGQTINARRDPETGELEFQGVLPPGRYAAIVYPSGNARPRFDLIPVDITGGPITLALRPPAAIAGSLRDEAGGFPADLRQARVTLRPSAFLPGLPEMLLPVQPVSADGKFSFPAISADRYTVQLSGLPEGVWAANLPETVDLYSGAHEPLEIVLSRKSGIAEGTVADAQGKPVEGAIVALVPVKGREYRTAVTDEEGKFTLKAPPGDYRAYAFKEVEPGAWTDPEFLKPLRAAAVQVRDGATASVTLAIR